MPSPVIDTLVLDFGQVVVDWEPARAYPHLSREQFDAVMAEIDFHALNLRADAGETWADLEREVAERWPEHAGVVAHYPGAFPATLTGPVDGVAALVAEAQAAGLRTYGLTNWSAETFPHGVHVAPVIGTLDGVVVSGEVGLVKPDPAIFEVLVERYDVVPERTLFVDDKEVNVEAALALGFHGHVFTGADGLRERLRSLGVDVGAAARTPGSPALTARSPATVDAPVAPVAAESPS